MVTFNCGGGDVSQESKSFEIPLDAVANASEVLHAMLNKSPMIESQTRIVNLPEVEPDTFELFVMYLQKDLHPDTSSGLRIMSQSPILKKTFCRGCKKPEPKEGLLSQYCTIDCYRVNGFKTTSFCQYCCRELADESSCDDCIPGYNFDADNSRIIGGSTYRIAGVNYRIGGMDVVHNGNLKHFAQLYVFADMYMAHVMKANSERLLYFQLAALKDPGCDKDLPAVLDLIRYIYEVSAVQSPDGTPGVCTALRSLILSFVIDRKGWFERRKAFTDFLEEHEEFAEDLDFALQMMQPQP